MLRWMHLRKLVPLTELIDGLEQQPAPAPGAGQGRAPRAERPLASTAISSRAQPPSAPAAPRRSTTPRAAPPASRRAQTPAAPAPEPVSPRADAGGTGSRAGCRRTAGRRQGGVSGRAETDEEVLPRNGGGAGAAGGGRRPAGHLRLHRGAAHLGQAGGNEPSVARGDGDPHHGAEDDGRCAQGRRTRVPWPRLASRHSGRWLSPSRHPTRSRRRRPSHRQTSTCRRSTRLVRSPSPRSRRRRLTARPTICCRRLWVTRPCRRCSKCSLPRSRTSRRSEPGCSKETGGRRQEERPKPIAHSPKPMSRKGGP